MKLFKNAFCTFWFEVSFMFAPLLCLIGVDQITIPKYCMSNSVLITYNKAHFNAFLLQFFFFTKITYNTFPFSMERSSCPIMCISSVDWSFCKTQRWTILQSHEHRGHNRLLYAWQKLLLSDETIGLRPLLRVKLVFCEGVKWLFCAWDERSGSNVFRQEVETLADGLEAPQRPMSKTTTLKTHPAMTEQCDVYCILRVDYLMLITCTKRLVLLP